MKKDPTAPGCRDAVDLARAVYRTLVLTGHRQSVDAAEMFWALPGGELADSVSLLARDPHFRIIRQPAIEELQAMKQGAEA